MARRSILTAQERQSLVALPDNQTDFIRHYSLSETDLSLIKQKRGDTNRLGFAIQLCYMRYLCTRQKCSKSQRSWTRRQITY